MRRREFLTIVGGAAAWPIATRAQQQSDRIRRIGVLMSVSMDDPEGRARFAAFQQALQQLGWSDGRNVRIETRWAGGKIDEARRYADVARESAHGHVLAFARLTEFGSDGARHSRAARRGVAVFLFAPLDGHSGGDYTETVPLNRQRTRAVH